MSKNTMVCPVCGKEFVANDDTKYLVHNQYTCSFKCFKDNHIKKMTPIWERRRKEREQMLADQANGIVVKKRGRKKKIKVGE